MNQDHSSYEGNLPDVKPAAPRSISIESADADSKIGRNNTPYNPGGTPNGRVSGRKCD
jgi:hypothetical protein